jgi:hypothetical protein
MKTASPAAKVRVTAEEASSPPTMGLSPIAKFAISAALVFHLLAVFVAPFSFASRVGSGASPLADGLMLVFRPYIDPLFLNHGYFFFAPNPGETHLVRYRLEFADGREPVVGVFPNLQEEWPRLLYHRHFMLSEAIHNAYVPADPRPEPSPPPQNSTAEQQKQYQQLKRGYDEQYRIWRHSRDQYEALRDSFADHLKSKYGASRVTITRVEHRNLLPDEMTTYGKQPGDADTYRDLPEPYTTP